MTQAITKPRGLLGRLMFAPQALTSTLSPAQQWLIDALGGNKANSGESVNPKTAMGLAVYFACIRNISEDQGKLPHHVYRRRGDGGRDKATEHKSYRLIHDQPNENMTSMVFHETLTSHALGWHGGFAEIVKDGGGNVLVMYPLDPAAVTVERREGDGVLRYRHRMPNGSDVILSQDRVLHLHGLGYDGLTGYAMWCIARDTIGNALATQNYRGQWFGNGAQPSGVLQVPAGFSPKAMEGLRKSFEERHEGEGNKGKTLLLEDGVTWNAVSVDAEKAQMLEAMDFDIEDICRRFRMPPNKVGHFKRAQGWSTVEMLNTDYVVDCLMSWSTRWEQEYNRKVFKPSEQSEYYVKFDYRGLLRGDSAARSAYYTALFNIGVLSENDIRELEDMNPVEDGDTRYVQGALMPVDLLREKLETDIETAKKKAEAPEPAPAAPNQPDSEPSPQDRAVFTVAIAGKHETLLTRELDALLKREQAKCKRIDNQPDKWLIPDENWWNDHHENVVAAFSRVFSSLATAIRPEVQQDERMHALARDEAAQHVNKSKTGDWTDGQRATRDAAAIVQRIVGKVLE